MSNHFQIDNNPFSSLLETILNKDGQDIESQKKIYGAVIIIKETMNRVKKNEKNEEKKNMLENIIFSLSKLFNY
jgi:uncharacterized membrane protein YqjE